MVCSSEPSATSLIDSLDVMDLPFPAANAPPPPKKKRKAKKLTTINFQALFSVIYEFRPGKAQLSCQRC